MQGVLSIRALQMRRKCANPTIDPQPHPGYPNPMKVTAQYAEAHFADLANAATHGEEVEIEVIGKPTLILVQRPAPVPFLRATPRILGEGVGEMAVPSWEEWKAIDKELEREGNDHPLIAGGL
jgi:antitoxin (DNA-binding transcriptional repressor) of toxin-antitoxin stability system